VRNESNARWIARLLDALWAPFMVTCDMLLLSAGTQRENAANGVMPPIEKASAERDSRVPTLPWGRRLV
jgi:hypothetical protein